MKAAAPLSLVALLAVSVVAHDLDPSANAVKRLHVSRAKARRLDAGKQFKRCKAKTTASSDPTPTPAPSAAPSAATSEPAASSTYSNNNSGGSSGGSGGVINVKTSGCGDIGATPDTTQTSGPNGSEAWLTCGIEGGGWNPPYITVNDLKFKDLGEEFNNDNSIFKPCKPYSSIIYDAAGAYGLPAIMIASIMMQESTCNKDTVGGGGEQGLMQITHEKCANAPGGDCKDPNYNIHTGSKYLADQIQGNNNNVLLALGSYNGWFAGLTYAKATAAAKTSCCRCQNNLDYPHQFLNGWMMAKDAYSSNLGTYKNLNVCN